MTFLAHKIFRPCQILGRKAVGPTGMLPSRAKNQASASYFLRLRITPLSSFATSNFQSDQVVFRVHGTT
jgi:hypothetical protein